MKITTFIPCTMVKMVTRDRCWPLNSPRPSSLFLLPLLRLSSLSPSGRGTGSGSAGAAGAPQSERGPALSLIETREKEWFVDWCLCSRVPLMTSRRWRATWAGGMLAAAAGSTTGSMCVVTVFSLLARSSRWGCWRPTVMSWFNIPSIKRGACLGVSKNGTDGKRIKEKRRRDYKEMGSVPKPSELPWCLHRQLPSKELHKKVIWKDYIGRK